MKVSELLEMHCGSKKESYSKPMKEGQNAKLDWPAGHGSKHIKAMEGLYKDLESFRKGRRLPAASQQAIGDSLDLLVSLFAKLKKAERGFYSK